MNVTLNTKLQNFYLIPDSRFPIPDSRFPIPDSRFPIPDSYRDFLSGFFIGIFYRDFLSGFFIGIFYRDWLHTGDHDMPQYGRYSLLGKLRYVAGADWTDFYGFFPG